MSRRLRVAQEARGLASTGLTASTIDPAPMASEMEDQP